MHKQVTLLSIVRWDWFLIPVGIDNKFHKGCRTEPVIQQCIFISLHNSNICCFRNPWSPSSSISLFLGKEWRNLYSNIYSFGKQRMGLDEWSKISFQKVASSQGYKISQKSRLALNFFNNCSELCFHHGDQYSKATVSGISSHCLLASMLHK